MNTLAHAHSKVSAHAGARFLRPTPEGVLHWLGTPEASAERALFRHILSGPEVQAVDVPSMAAATGLATRDVSKAMFALHRHGSIRVELVCPAADPHARSWIALARHLRGMATRAEHGRLVLSDPQGLPIASAFALEDEVQRMAAGQTQSDVSAPLQTVELYLNETPFLLRSHVPLNSNDPGWVEIVRCICGLMLPTETH